MTRREDPGKGVGMNVFCQAESALPRSGDLPVWNAETVRREFRAAAGSGQGGSIVGEWKDGHEQMPPVGWKVRDGQVLGNVSAKCPELRAHLERPENAWKLKTEAEWQAPSRAAGGVDGAWFYVLDQAADTIRLPDTPGAPVQGAERRASGGPFLTAWRFCLKRGIIIPDCWKSALGRASYRSLCCSCSFWPP